ncbi:dTMP kinase [Cocleimonas sp. KMM 6892]|uniref:dTMP kinase n=1 Tax=unclassified Cocleimonas TaxID=2639732 RepID=UPI002DB7A77F|nr:MULTISPECIES: dTMP kinase [unclassified Cocleimonas]MEB8432276.1 dTMP kinase [Cocleimonas sp. KMM 6892]MEC4714638.1 dTMP kinase [Cocleimonas sp. KMM 6895]MEC4744548.1 dTMP kinase [Cocleimonas sp. KMM 6896]
MTKKNAKHGLFISFEGVEGAGKTTNIEYIAEKIEASGQEILLTREPGGTDLGEAIRELLVSKEFPEMHSTTELLLMFAARAEHLHRKIIPALEQGKWVLCDRFTDATYAYQGAGRDIDLQNIQTLENLVQGTLRPDYTFLFDIDADIGLARAKNRGETDRFEQQHLDFFNRVRSAYLKMAEENPQRYRIVNAQYDLQTVQKQIDTLLGQIIQ